MSHTTPHLPGTPVWLAPDPDGGEYSVVRGVVARWVDWVGCYEVMTESGRHVVNPGDVFEVESEAVENRRRVAAENVNRAKARQAEAEQFLGRP